MKDWIYEITGKAWLALVFGIAILGWAGYTQFKAASDTHGAAVDALVSKKGTITGGVEVTETTKRRRGGSYTSHYFELDAKIANGSMEKWRVDRAVGRNKIESLIDETVEVRVDTSDKNMVYEARLNGQPVVSLNEVQKIMENKDKAAAARATDKATLVVGSLALLLGIFGLILRHLIGNNRAAKAALVPPPVIGEKV